MTEVSTELDKKANLSYMVTALSPYSDKTYVDDQLALKANHAATKS